MWVPKQAKVVSVQSGPIVFTYFLQLDVEIVSGATTRGLKSSSILSSMCIDAGPTRPTR